MSDRGFVPEGQHGPPAGDLSSLIQRTRDQVAKYLGQARTRQRRLLNVAIVAGALARPWRALRPLSAFSRRYGESSASSLLSALWLQPSSLNYRNQTVLAKTFPGRKPYAHGSRSSISA